MGNVSASKFPKLSKANLKQEVFTGPDIQKLLPDSLFLKIMEGKEKDTLLCFKMIVHKMWGMIKENRKAINVLDYKDLSKKRILIHGDLIKGKARQYYNQMKELEPTSSSSRFKNVKFSASNGGLNGFLRRNALHNVRIQGEAASANETTAKRFCKVLSKIIDDGGYCQIKYLMRMKLGY
ncbi:hypothetical protein TNCV_3291821 [Trichonephila clavipes]|nr:hypothetical protein TNCV_3291821 [Trichonephila clavipes]